MLATLHMANGRTLSAKVLAATVLAALALSANASGGPTGPSPGQLLNAWEDAVAQRGIAVPAASYDVAVGDWMGLPGRSWIDVAHGRIYLSPEIAREARDASFPQGRREMRLQLLHELGHALDAELTDTDRASYAAIMNHHREWVATSEARVDAEQPPNERFAVAYSAVAAGLRYDRLRPDYGFEPTRAQYRRLAAYFQGLAGR
jgi:hypothetical protein